MDLNEFARHVHDLGWRSHFDISLLRTQGYPDRVKISGVDFDGDYYVARGRYTYGATTHGVVVGLRVDYRYQLAGSYRLGSNCDCEERRNGNQCAHVRHMCEALEKIHLAGEIDTQIRYFAAALEGFGQPPTQRAQKDQLLLGGHLSCTKQQGSQVGQFILTPFLIKPDEGAREPMRIEGFRDVERSCSGEDSLLFNLLLPDDSEIESPIQIWLETHGHERAFIELLHAGRLSLPYAKKGTWSHGPDVHPSTRWVMDNNGDQRLKMCTSDGTPIDYLAAIVGAWYIDQPSGTIGKLCVPLENVLALLNAPVIPASRSATVRDRWLKLARPSAPPPFSAADVKNLMVVPKPRITTQTKSAADSEANQDIKAKPTAKLTFEYDGIEVRPELFGTDGTLVVDTPAGPRRIFRNRDAEMEVHKRLADRGLSRTNQMGAGGCAFGGNEYAIPNQQPQADARFLNAISALSADGFSLDADEAGLSVVDVENHEHFSADLTPSTESSWFDLSLGVEIDGIRQDLAPLIVSLLEDKNFQLTPAQDESPDMKWAIQLQDGKLIRLPIAKLRQFLSPIAEWMDRNASSSTGAGTIRLSRLQAAAIAEEIGSRSHLLPDLRTAIKRLRHIEDVPEPGEPEGFVGQLRQYQKQGLRWLDALAEGELGGLLADDMGLGKTVQILAHILSQKAQGRCLAPSLIVVPKSLVGNWASEAAKFAPSLRVLVLHGPDRAGHFDRIEEHDLIITSYAILLRDAKMLSKVKFSLAVFDEANAIKNYDAKTAMSARMLRPDRTIAVTGTPVENHMGDLWAQVDLVLPTMLGDRRHFTKAYRTPIEKHGAEERMHTLQGRLAPFILRRTKAEVMVDLPPKTEIVQRIEIAGAQRALYESMRVAMQERVQQAILEKGLSQSGIIILDALLKLRQACCDPRLVKLKSAQAVKESAKLEMLKELVEPLVEDGRKILIFSQFTSMLDLISEQLESSKIRYVMLTGSTNNRELVIQEFQQGDVPVFLISLKAGGVGLNLTAADTVIHYDPWWNPAAENQATDRAHRMGQDKPVFVYKFICTGTVEEKIIALQERKSGMANALLDGGTTKGLSFTDEDVAMLFAPE